MPRIFKLEIPVPKVVREVGTERDQLALPKSIAMGAKFGITSTLVTYVWHVHRAEALQKRADKHTVKAATSYEKVTEKQTAANVAEAARVEAAIKAARVNRTPKKSADAEPATA